MPDDGPSSDPKNTNTLPFTFVTVSPHGWSSYAPGSDSANDSRLFRVRPGAVAISQWQGYRQSARGAGPGPTPVRRHEDRRHARPRVRRGLLAPGGHRRGERAGGSSVLAARRGARTGALLARVGAGTAVQGVVARAGRQGVVPVSAAEIV